MHVDFLRMMVSLRPGRGKRGRERRDALLVVSAVLTKQISDNRDTKLRFALMILQASGRALDFHAPTTILLLYQLRGGPCKTVELGVGGHKYMEQLLGLPVIL